MDIPSNVRILCTIETGSVYYFKEESINTNEPHYYIVVNNNPRDDNLIFLVIASTKIEKRKSVARRLRFPSKTQIIVSPSECDVFRYNTVIDCNTVFEKTSQTLIDKLEQKKLKVCSGVISDDILKKIRRGILISPKISKNIKNILS